MLATLHRCDVDAVPLTHPMRDGIEDELVYWERYLAWASKGAPTRRLTDTLAWCRETAPGPDHAPRSLLWGDPRLGNVIWSDATCESTGAIAALIDWEGASLGPPEMDLGWYLALDALTTHFVGRIVPGFLDRAGVIECYERALGRTVEHLGWHEVFALVRSTCINECQARRSRRVPAPAIPASPVTTTLYSTTSGHASTRPRTEGRQVDEGYVPAGGSLTVSPSLLCGRRSLRNTRPISL